jgi:isorenieratene synthase
MTDAKVLFEHLEVRQDFPAFHTGMHADRPGVKTENERLYLAGDWVKTPLPCMLMEGAFVSGMMAANHIFSREGLRQNTIYTVPTRGVLADL